MSKATAETEILAELADVSDDPDLVDSNIAPPHGIPCTACGCPIEPLDKFCPACGTSAVVEATVVTDTPEPPEQKHFRCENCGSEVATDPEQRSYVCPFCDSTYVVEFSPIQTNRQDPEFVIGFSVTADDAREMFGKWIRENGWFQPGDLKDQASLEKLKGVYLPFWSFSMLAESEWSANIGEYWYRTETYTTRDSKGRTVTKTRRVRETEWWPLDGRHHRYYSGFMVSASRGLPQRDAESIKPFNLPALKRYEPFYLAGWLCEEYSVEKDQALGVCQQEFHRREQSNITQFLPGDTSRSLQVSTIFSNVNSDLCLLPIYILSYHYGEEVYRFLVNGQTGKHAGTKPTSQKRVWGAIGAVAALVLLIVAVVMLLAQG